MRDVIAGLIALGLFLFALGLMSTLRFHRRRRERERSERLASGQTVVAEIPTQADLELFTSDEDHFHWDETQINKNEIQVVKVLINGSPLVSYVSRRHQFDDSGDSDSFAERPEGIAHDRWDVLIRTAASDTLVECGSIRERVSQELARRVFDAVKTDMTQRDVEAISPLAPTTHAL